MHEAGDADGPADRVEPDDQRSTLRQALPAALRNRPLVRAQLALAGARTVDLAQLVVVSTYLFTVGGVTSVGAFAVVRTLAPVLGVPVLTTIGRRRPPGAVLLTMAIVAGGGSLAMAFTIEMGGATGGILICAAVVGVAIGSVRPIVRGLLPTLARSPGDLVAANATTGFVDSAATLLGPVLGVVVAASAGVPALLAPLDGGSAMIGGLHAALGIGGLVVLPVTVSVVAAVGVHRSVTMGLVLWGAPLVVCALTANPLAALGMFAIIGIGDAVVDVGYYGVLQGAVPAHVLTRVLGVVEAMFQAGVAVGAFVSAALLEAFGPRIALVAIGLPLPVLAAATTARLSSLRVRPATQRLVVATS